jgi:DNA-binding MarR family transcriptional regulator
MLNGQSTVLQDELLKLDNQLCYALYAASRRVIRAYNDILAELQITYPQYVVLLVLWEWDRTGMITPNYVELGKRVELDAGTLTPILTRLEARGLVIRTIPTTDRRERHISLTKQGRALRRRALRVPLALIERSPLSLTDLVKLRDDLKRLNNGMASAPVGGAVKKRTARAT